MLRSRALWLGLFASGLLAAQAAPALADVPSPDGRPNNRQRPPFYLDPPPQPVPAPIPVPQPLPPIPPPVLDEGPPPPPNNNEKPAPPKPEPKTEMWPNDPVVKPEPKRGGPFRSCGSGMGLGLAGIGAAWALIWLGTRFAGRVSRNAKK